MAGDILLLGPEEDNRGTKKISRLEEAQARHYGVDPAAPAAASGDPRAGEGLKISLYTRFNHNFERRVWGTRS